MKPIRIAKSEINKIEFTLKESVNSKERKRAIKQKLKAAALRTDKNQKLEVTFKSRKRGLFSVNSRVIVADKDYVILKGGHVIPMNSITKAV